MKTLLALVSVSALLLGRVDGDPALTDPAITTEGSVASVEVTPLIDTLASLHDTVTFVAFVWDSDGTIIGGKTFKWSSSDPTVARIDEASGLATAMGNGTATISANVESVTGTASVVVAQAWSVMVKPRLLPRPIWLLVMHWLLLLGTRLIRLGCGTPLPHRQTQTGERM